MKKYFLTNSVIFPLLCSLLLVLVGCSTEEISLESSTDDLETTATHEGDNTLDDVGAKGVPKFNLFHPTRGTNASIKNDRFFNRSGRTHKFYLPKGIINKKVSRKHARIEASQTSGRWGPGRKNHSFEATFSVSTTLPKQVTILQQFAVSKGPQTRIEIRKNGDLKAAFSDGKPVTLAKKGEYNRDNFKVKIVTNGKVTSVFLNGKKKVNNKKVRFKSKTNQFRWGLYYNTKPPKAIRSTVKNINVN